MSKFLLTILTCFQATCYTSCEEMSAAEPNIEIADDEGEKNEFWPADMVPHPHPPGSGPSGPSDPEMA